MNTVTVEVDLDEVTISPHGIAGDILHREVVEKDGEKLIMVGYLGIDGDCGNPCEDDEGMGTMYSFNRRHSNFIHPNDVESKVEKRFRKYGVFLSYYEHGNCLWDVQGGERYGMCPDKQWDGVGTAGFWVPNDVLLGEIRYRFNKWKKEQKLRKTTKEQRSEQYAKITRELARQCCETYTSWCNGDCYGYVVELYNALGDEVEHLDSCWGFIGDDYVKEQLAETFKHNLNKFKKENNDTTTS
jgi:hypothetical protein